MKLLDETELNEVEKKAIALLEQSSEAMKAAGLVLRKARCASGVSLSNIARQMGYTPAYVSVVELGTKRGSAEFVRQYLEAIRPLRPAPSNAAPRSEQDLRRIELKPGGNTNAIPAIADLNFLANHAGVSRRFLEMEITRGRLTALRLSSRVVRIRREDWERYLELSATQSNTAS